MKPHARCLVLIAACATMAVAHAQTEHAPASGILIQTDLGSDGVTRTPQPIETEYSAQPSLRPTPNAPPSEPPKAKPLPATAPSKRTPKLHQPPSASPGTPTKAPAIHYEQALDQALQAFSLKRPQEGMRILQPWQDEIMRRRDQPAARLMAQFAGRLGREAERRYWKMLLADWSEQPLSPTAETSIAASPVTTRSLFSAAVSRQDDPAVVQAFPEIEAPTTADHEQLGWSLLRLGRPAEAAQAFEQAYRGQASESEAKGLVFSLMKAGETRRLQQLGKQLGEPLQGRLGDAETRAALADNLPPSFFDVDADGNVRLDRAALPQEWVGIGAAGRHKSGTHGLDRMNLFQTPALHTSQNIGHRLNLDLDLHQVTLFSGTPADDALLGTRPAANAPATPYHALDRVDGMEGYARLRPTTGYSWDAGLGFTATGGALPSTWMGHASLALGDRPEAYRVTLARKPERASMLAYTGQIDPVTGGTWGRVMENSLRLAHGLELRDWRGSLSLKAAELEGVDVMHNHRYELYLAATHPVITGHPLAIRIGPELFAQGHERNLGYFTWGQGGYFSPQWLVRAGVMATLDYHRQHTWLRARFSAGLQAHHEEETDYFPLAPDGQMHAGNDSRGPAAEIELAGAHRIPDSSWEWGFALRGRSSPGYADVGGMFQIRYLFGPDSRQGTWTRLPDIDQQGLY